MFKYFMVSIVIAPVLLGVYAARRRRPKRGSLMLKVGWLVYAGLWFCTLYYLRYRWR